MKQTGWSDASSAAPLPWQRSRPVRYVIEMSEVLLRPQQLTEVHMDDPARYAAEKPVDMPEAKTDWYRQRLRQLGIDPDADPIDILIQLTDYCQKLRPKS